MLVSVCGLESLSVYMGKQSTTEQLTHKNYHGQGRCELLACQSVSCTYSDPLSVQKQLQFLKELNHIRSYCSKSRSVLEEKEHEDQ